MESTIFVKEKNMNRYFTEQILIETTNYSR